MSYRATLNDEEFFNTSTSRSDLNLVSASIQYSAGSAGSFTFTVPNDNVCAEEFDPDESFYLSDIVDVYRKDPDEEYLIFSGRVTKCTRNFDLSIDVVCEGLLAMLNDVLSAPVILGTDDGEGEGITTMAGIIDYFVTEYNLAQTAKGTINYLRTNSIAEDGTNNGVQYSYNTTKTSCTLIKLSTASSGLSYSNLIYSANSEMPDGIEAGKTYEFSLEGGYQSVRLAVIFQKANHSTIKTVYVTTKKKKITVPSDTVTMTVRLETGFNDLYTYRTVSFSCYGPIGTGSGTLSIGRVSDVSVEMNDLLSSYEPMLNRLQTVVNEVGGYLSMVKEDGDLFLCYTSESDLPVLNQSVKLGSNLLSMTYLKSADNIVTCIFPKGNYDGTEETVDPSKTSTQNYLNNHGMEFGVLKDGSVYVGLTSAINKYGKIIAAKTFTTKSTASSSLALTKASYKYLKNKSEPEKSIDLSVVDLTNAGNNLSDMDMFEVASKIVIESGPHLKSNLTVVCTDKTMNLLDPSSDSVTFDVYRKRLPKYLTG